MRRASAFTLVEIMIVVSIIALLAVIAVPSFLRARQRAQNARFANSVRVLNSAFLLYAIENKTYPANTAIGVLPAGMDSYLGPTMDFTGTTPIGGKWDWANRKTGSYIGVCVVNPTADTTQLQAIDAAIDDGDLSQGNFFMVSAGRYISIVE
ncbi:MAG: type II secretion system protein [Chthoniobacterales bacterium]|nr:type II secretion system protein [Chthoniobacterales bacterium]